MAKHKRKGGSKAAAAKPATAKPATASSDAATKPKTATPRAAVKASRTSSATAPPPAAITEPVFWFGFEVSWAKLVLGRVVLFGLLAGDALLQIRHAPRYGAGGFNVTQLPWTDWLAPSRVAYGTCELLNGYLFVMIACGVATRWLMPIAATIYAWLYFGSQLDSYQHHYLVALILVVACFIPWQRPVDAKPATPVRSWALRLVLVELGIVYLWAAISKLDPAWFDGRVLATQISGSLKSLIEHTVGWKVASALVVVAELVLAGTVWLKPLWKIAAPLGILLHLGIVVSGLEIGLFAWLMIALYIFVIPDRIWIAIADRMRWPSWAAIERRRWAVVAVALIASVVLAVLCRLPAALGVAIAATIIVALVIGALATWTTARRATAIAAAHLAAIATWFAIDRTSAIAYDYYKFWGGTSRRFKDPDNAERAYRRLIAIAPDDPLGHYHIGRLLLDRDASEEGLAELHAAQALDTQHARAYTYEARWLASHDRKPEALAKAREAALAEPSDADARGLVQALEAGRTAKPPRPDLTE